MGVINWIFSEHGIAAAVLVISLLKAADTIWSAKESRAERLRKIAVQAFTTAEGLAVETKMSGSEKFAAYMRQARALAQALGAPLTADDEKYLRELSITQAKSKKAAPNSH